jgi:hypothetical protein
VPAISRQINFWRGEELIPARFRYCGAARCCIAATGEIPWMISSATR